VRYVPSLTTNGTYEVYLWWVEASNRPTNTPVDIVHSAGTTRVLVNQRASSGGWFKVLTTNFNQGTSSSVTIRNDGTAAGTYVVADGVRFNPVGDIAPVITPTVELVAGDAAAGEFGPDTGRFSLVRSGNTNAILTINLQLTGTATPGLDYSNLVTVATMGSGVIVTNFAVRPIPDALVEGPETVQVRLLPGSGYLLTTLTNVTIQLADQPIDRWRKDQFSGTELSQGDVSGDLADPDGDRLSNLMEYALGTNPRSDEPVKRPHPRVEGGVFLLTYSVAKAATDVVIELEESTDLAHWNTGAIQLVEEHESGNVIERTVRLITPVPEKSPAYLSLRARRL
jgi:hypothetical protein